MKKDVHFAKEKLYLKPKNYMQYSSRPKMKNVYALLASALNEPA